MKRFISLHLVLLAAVCVYGGVNNLPQETQASAPAHLSLKIASHVESADLSIQSTQGTNSGNMQSEMGRLPVAALALPWTLLMVLACCWPKSDSKENQQEMRNLCIPVGWE